MVRRFLTGAQDHQDPIPEAYRGFFRALPRIETARLTLRAAEPQDAEGLYALNSDPDVAYRSMSAQAHSLEECTRAILRIRAAARAGRPTPWSMIHRERAMFVGTCGLTEITGHNSAAMVGYAIRREFWNQGLTSEALAAVIDLLFSSTDLYRIGAMCFPDNPASMRVMEKAGMVHEGVLRGYLVFRNERKDSAVAAIVRPDWEARRAAQAASG